MYKMLVITVSLLISASYQISITSSKTMADRRDAQLRAKLATTIVDPYDEVACAEANEACMMLEAMCKDYPRCPKCALAGYPWPNGVCPGLKAVCGIPGCVWSWPCKNCRSSWDAEGEKFVDIEPPPNYSWNGTMVYDSGTWADHTLDHLQPWYNEDTVQNKPNPEPIPSYQRDKRKYPCYAQKDMGSRQKWIYGIPTYGPASHAQTSQAHPDQTSEDPSERMEENLLMENEAAEALRFAKDEAREAYAKDSEANAEAIDQAMESIVDGQGE